MTEIPFSLTRPMEPNRNMEKKNNNVGEIFTIFTEHSLKIISLAILLCTFVGYFYEYRLLKEFNINIVSFAEIDDFFLAGLKNPIIFILTFPVLAIELAYIFYIRNTLEDSEKKLIEIAKDLEELSDIAKAKNQHPLITWRNIWINRIFRKELVKKYSAAVRSIEDQKIENSQLRKFIKKKNESLISELIFSSAVCIAFIGVLSHYQLMIELESITKNPEQIAYINLRNKITLPTIDNCKKPLVFITATNKYTFFYQHGTSKKENPIYVIPNSNIINIKFSNNKCLSK